MFQDVSLVQQIGVAVLALATVVWAVGLVRTMRRDRLDAEARFDVETRFDVAARHDAEASRPVPSLTIVAQPGPPRAETVELTPDERAAFAGLVRQFGDGRS
ncbi:hypothetical protein [Streptomyces sp. NPDC029674]|uniref:hypothetical protein n=1 Tax=Streptomyces sp. NPDC029674 TaxID=3365297 RepID=UPI00384F7C86